ncbi:MAG: hypothetical protein AAF721_34770 [Myxococcota bacterium]
MRIREFVDGDWPAVWAILRPIFRAGETYACARDISEADARLRWVAGASEAFVAQDPRTNAIVGTYYLKPNYDGPGSPSSLAPARREPSIQR